MKNLKIINILIFTFAFSNAFAEINSFQDGKNLFDEKKFINDHSKDYYELKEDSFDQLLANVDRLTIIVNLNNKEVFNQEGKLGKELKVLLEKETIMSWKDFVESDESTKTVLWGHGGMISSTYIFNNHSLVSANFWHLSYNGFYGSALRSSCSCSSTPISLSKFICVVNFIFGSYISFWSGSFFSFLNLRFTLLR